MIIVNERLRKQFSGAGTCEFCFTRCRQRFAHHIKPKGIGSGSCLDLRINLISLGEDWDCECHRGFHDKGWPAAGDFRSVVARREHTTPDAIEYVCNRLLRLPRSPSPSELRAAIEEARNYGEAEALLLQAAFTEAGATWHGE